MAIPQPTYDETEVWRGIPGYEGFYEASSFGRIRSVDRRVPYADGRVSTFRGIVLSQCFNSGGRYSVPLSKNGKSITRSVQRLVLEAFEGLAPKGMEACHNNGNKLDNRIENLRWDTKSNNAFDSIGHGTHQNAGKAHCLRGHELIEPNLVLSGAKRGRRNCLACDRARSSRKGKKIDPEAMQALSDERYQDIIKK